MLFDMTLKWSKPMYDILINDYDNDTIYVCVWPRVDAKTFVCLFCTRISCSRSCHSIEHVARGSEISHGYGRRAWSCAVCGENVPLRSRDYRVETTYHHTKQITHNWNLLRALLSAHGTMISCPLNTDHFLFQALGSFFMTCVASWQ